MKVVIVHPTHLSTPSGIKFDTYRFYLACICEYLVGQYSDIGTFISSSYKNTSNIGKLSSLDASEIERFLKIAWNTEYLLSIDHGDPEITRINNQWTPIQAYYAVYSGLEALSYAINGDHAGSHQTALTKCSDFLINQGISPWNLAFVGNRGRSGSNHRPANFPPGITIPHNLRRSGVQPLEMIAKCLKAEHFHRIDDKWISKKKSGSYLYQYDPKPTTILHFLYRLRIKSNYKDIDIFVSNAPNQNILQFAESLHLITTWTLSIIEIILMKRFGKTPIFSQIKSYLSVNPSASDLDNRFSEYKKLK